MDVCNMKEQIKMRLNFYHSFQYCEGYLISTKKIITNKKGGRSHDMNAKIIILIFPHQEYLTLTWEYNCTDQQSAFFDEEIECHEIGQKKSHQDCFVTEIYSIYNGNAQFYRDFHPL